LFLVVLHGATAALLDSISLRVFFFYHIAASTLHESYGNLTYTIYRRNRYTGLELLCKSTFMEAAEVDTICSKSLRLLNSKLIFIALKRPEHTQTHTQTYTLAVNAACSQGFQLGGEPRSMQEFGRRVNSRNLGLIEKIKLINYSSTQTPI
jgi:hypothetical protein